MILALRSADALSLGNFQQITAVLLPNSCSSAYDGQIPSCTTSDFNNQCSLGCQAGLNQVAKNVQSGCANVSVNPNALLGIVMSGGIIPALCPSVEKATSTVAKTTTPVAVSSAAASVTIPTANPGVTGGGGLDSKQSTTASAQTQVTIATTRSAQASTTSTAEASTPSAAQPTTVVSSSVESTSTNTVQGAGAASTTAASITTATSRKGPVATTSQSAAAAASPKAAPKADGGGGSPFDISSNDVNGMGHSILSVLVAAAWAGVLLAR
jgi:hypothetical protein